MQSSSFRRAAFAVALAAGMATSSLAWAQATQPAPGVPGKEMPATQHQEQALKPVPEDKSSPAQAPQSAGAGTTTTYGTANVPKPTTGGGESGSQGGATGGQTAGSSTGATGATGGAASTTGGQTAGAAAGGQTAGGASTTAPGAGSPTAGMPASPHQQDTLKPVPDASGAGSKSQAEGGASGGAGTPPAGGASTSRAIAPSGGQTTSDPAVTVSPGASGQTGAGAVQNMPVSPHQGQAIAPGGAQTKQ